MTREEARKAAERTVATRPYARDPELRAAAIDALTDALLTEAAQR